MLDQQIEINPLTESNDNNGNQNQVTNERNVNYQKQIDDEEKEESQPVMVLNIDIGNNQIEHLRIYDIDQPEKDAYEFCFQHQLDYSSLVEITRQIHAILNENKKTSSNEALLQENIMTTVQTESKIEHLGTNNQSAVRNQNNNTTFQDQNPNLQSYTEIKESNKRQIAPKELITNPIIVTENNQFYLVNKPKYKQIKEQPRYLTNKSINGQRQKRNMKEKGAADNKFDSIGVKMYEKGLDTISKRKIKVETLRDALNKSDEEIYTFHPQVNIQTPNEKHYRETNNKAYNNLQIILNYKQFNEKKQQKIIEKIKEQDYNEDNKILFTPSINKRKATKDSNDLNQSQSFTSRFEKLYKDKDILKNKIESISKSINAQYTYCPKLNKNNKSVDKKLQNSFKSDKKKWKILNGIEYQNNYDKETKQKLFQPKLIAKYKATKDNSNEEAKNRYETMYNFASIYKKNKLDLAAEVNYKETVQTYSSLKTSNDLLKKKKYNSFKQLFKLIDSDEDGIISSNCYNLSKLPKDIIVILKPILNEFKEDYETLNELEFIKVCDQLYQYCSREHKNTLITLCDSHNKKQKNPPLPLPFSFKPNINKNSANIVKKIDKVFDIDLPNISRIGVGNSFNNI